MFSFADYCGVIFEWSSDFPECSCFLVDVSSLKLDSSSGQNVRRKEGDVRYKYENLGCEDQWPTLYLIDVLIYYIF